MQDRMDHFNSISKDRFSDLYAMVQYTIAGLDQIACNTQIMQITYILIIKAQQSAIYRMVIMPMRHRCLLELMRGSWSSTMGWIPQMGGQLQPLKDSINLAVDKMPC